MTDTAERPPCVLAKTGYVQYDMRPGSSATTTFHDPLPPAEAWALHQWVARTDIPVDAEEAAEVYRQGWWVAGATHNRDGLTRVQAHVVCSACGEKYTPPPTDGVPASCPAGFECHRSYPPPACRDYESCVKRANDTGGSKGHD